MPRENRRYERYEVSGAVQSKSVNIIRGINVSLSGIRILMDKKLDNNHVIDMTFSMPGITNIFAAEAKVVWQKPLGVENKFDTGLVFNKINVDKRKE